MLALFFFVSPMVLSSSSSSLFIRVETGAYRPNHEVPAAENGHKFILNEFKDVKDQERYIAGSPRWIIR
jgi:hypothetical protein